jgi:hypothetical protein
VQREELTNTVAGAPATVFVKPHHLHVSDEVLSLCRHRDKGEHEDEESWMKYVMQICTSLRAFLRPEVQLGDWLIALV